MLVSCAQHSHIHVYIIQDVHFSRFLSLLGDDCMLRRVPELCSRSWLVVFCPMCACQSRKRTGPVGSWAHKPLCVLHFLFLGTKFQPPGPALSSPPLNSLSQYNCNCTIASSLGHPFRGRFAWLPSSHWPDVATAPHPSFAIPLSSGPCCC